MRRSDDAEPIIRHVAYRILQKIVVAIFVPAPVDRAPSVVRT